MVKERRFNSWDEFKAFLVELYGDDGFRREL